jgi:hypothetical protein
MKNLRMAEKLRARQALDVGTVGLRHPSRQGVWILPKIIDGMDYCDAQSESWIWSIGMDKKTGQILASTTTEFYENPDYECLWLR